LLGDFLHIIREDYKKAYAAYKYACDQFKSSKACTAQGMFAFEGRGTKKDVVAASKLFQFACERGSGEACFYLGQMLSGKDPDVREAGVTPNITKAMLALERGCEYDYPDSCAEAGPFYLEGESFGQPKDPVKAFKFMEMACNHSAPHIQACGNLMLMYMKGIGTKKDSKAAAEVQEKVDEYVKMLTKKRSLEMQQGT
jgi:TPR repeat protein